jgi:hypothetical protein
MKTECNCDLPLYAYKDFLIEQGWEGTFDEEEFEYTFGWGGHFWHIRELPSHTYWHDCITSGNFVGFTPYTENGCFGMGWSDPIDTTEQYDIKDRYNYVLYSGDGSPDWIWGYR